MQREKSDPFEDPAEFDVQADESPSADADAAEASKAPEHAPAAGTPRGEPSPALEEELAKHRDAILRMQAEMENLRKRLARDAERSRKFALERIMKDLLSVSDSMERGLEVADDSATVDSLREGQELTLRMLSKVLQDHGLEVINPAGEAFDPEWHEAMTVIPSEDVEENTVLEVLQKGYRLHDRLIRPARVVVSRKP